MFRSAASRSNKRDNIETIYPATPVQQGMLFHSLLDPVNRPFVEQVEWIMRGQLDETAFRWAWQRVVNQHAILRTAFFWDRLEEAVQIVNRRIEVPVDVLDWRGMPEGDREDRWAMLLAEDRRRGFELSRAPLMRLFLVRTTENSHRFLWTFHHILLDGWSWGRVAHEVLATYEASVKGHDLRLGAPRPYRDYVTWLKRKDFGEAEAYWRQQLAGFETPTPLGTGRGLVDYLAESARQPVIVSHSTTAGLRGLAKRSRLTLNTFLQGAWALLLSRYTHVRDVVFGVVVSGRPAELSGVEEMVGLFINALPVRVRVSPQTRLLDWLQALQAQHAELLEYQYAPLVRVQEWSNVPRGTPLFDTLVVFENYPVDPALRERLSSLAVCDVQFHARDNYGATLCVGENKADDTIEGFLEYNTALFDDAAVTRLVDHLKTLLTGFATTPDARLTDVPMLTEIERENVLVRWSNTHSDYPAEECIQQLFEARVHTTPDALAMAIAGTSLTYGDLNAQANQLAWYLRELGVGPDVAVAICLERSLDMVIGLLGILKAGGAYVPLDPTYPAERLAFMLSDSQARILVTRRRLVQHLPTSEATEVVWLDGLRETLRQYPQKDLPSRALPENLAYIIYTSGSTGVPKGVGTTHRSVVNHNAFVRREFRIQPDDRVLQFASLSFDAAAEELFPCWLAGATLVLFPYDELISFSDFLRFIEAERLTVLDLPTAYWRQWTDDLSLSDQLLPNCLRTVIVGGETVTAEALRAWKGRTSSVRWINTYGPTEATIITTLHEPTGDVRKTDSIVRPPIGRPIANTGVYILDPDMNAVPVGIAGEIYIGGLGLARGYVNRPSITAERFVPDPFGKAHGARLYKTGDLGRFLPDGNIEFVGRIDAQVKIRGFRIEPGEVEAVLRRHHAVRDAAVVAQEDGAGGQRLIAYVLRKDKDLHHNELRGFLELKLTEYMLPSDFVLLDNFPLTLSGKVDRRALSAGRGCPESSAAVYVAPRTETEKRLAEIVEQVLGVDRVGIHDNFFELGGHSLLAAQAVSRICHAFQRELPLRVLFIRPTVAGLAEVIDEAERARSVS